MVVLVLVFDVFENLKGFFRGGGLYHHFLEAALERAVLLDVLAVFVKSGGADALYLAAGERRLEEVGGVHRAGGVAGSDDGVQLVDEQYHVGAFRQLVENGLYPLLELSAVFRAGHNRGHVERHNPLVEKNARHFALHDAQGQPFDDG